LKEETLTLMLLQAEARQSKAANRSRRRLGSPRDTQRCLEEQLIQNPHFKKHLFATIFAEIFYIERFGHRRCKTESMCNPLEFPGASSPSSVSVASQLHHSST
jgi:hypothetical protein